MAILFILVWLPQFLYWFAVAGKFFYFSYGEVGSAFYFNNPQIINVLFSIKKGLYIYTPVMFFATIGLYFLIRQKKNMGIAALIFFVLNLYVLSSWWSWWFGGGYGNRAFIDSYAVMAFPLAALIDQFGKVKKIRIIIIAVFILLTAQNYFQTQQYRHTAIHYFWMNKEAYRETFWKLRPTCKYWNILLQPDVPLARKGIYKAIPFADNKVTREDLYKEIEDRLSFNTHITDSLKLIAENSNRDLNEIKANYINQYIDDKKALKEYKYLRKSYLIHQMNTCTSWKKEIMRKAKRRNVSFEQMEEQEASRIFEKYSQKYLSGF